MVALVEICFGSFNYMPYFARTLLLFDRWCCFSCKSVYFKTAPSSKKFSKLLDSVDNKFNFVV